jgi:DNA-binding NarL/FixJ family response regulator
MYENNKQNIVKLGIVENDEFFLAEVQERLQSITCIQNVHTWSSSERFLHDIENVELEILFLDIMLPGMSGIDLVGKLTNEYPNLKVIMLTNMNSDEMIFNSIKNGALGYILKSDIGRLEEIINVVRNGGATITPTIALRVFSSFRKPASQETPKLTEREIQILQLLVKGKTISSVAKFLVLSEHTIHGYVKSIYKKLSVHNRVELAIKAENLSLL